MADIFLSPYVRTYWALLNQRFQGKRGFCIFGAGAHTRWLLSVTRDLPRHNLRLILDDTPRTSEIEGIPVCSPAEFDASCVDAVLISSDQWESKLAARAMQQWGDSLEIIRLYEGIPEGPYDKQDDRTVCRDLIETRTAEHRVSTSQHLDGNRVALVSAYPKAREAKLAIAIRHAGWEPILIFGQEPAYDADRYFSQSLQYQNEWHALRLALESNCAIAHAIANSDYRLASRFVEDAPIPVVVDTYDVIAGMYTESFLQSHPSFVHELARERFCLENADGLCCRSREVDHLEEYSGYRVGPRLLLPDGCWNGSGVATPSASSSFDHVSDDELHTVYVGHMHPREEPDSPFHAHGSKLWLAETLANAAVHFHVYPFFGNAYEMETGYQPYRELAARSPYFHWHEPVAPDALIPVLSNYDMALFVYNELAQPDCPANTYSDAKFTTGASNKIFDFMDAGLPVAHTAFPGSYQSALLKDQDVLIDLNNVVPSDWSALFESLDHDTLKKRAADARQAYDIRNSASGLIAFYEMLIQTDRTRTDRSGPV
ncbi:MAG: hypothetical protein ACPGXK_10370, partial [Phycisphaerae bacterium]